MIMTGLPTWDIVNMVQNIISMVMSAAQLGLTAWLFTGGILYIVRGISFFLDIMLINFIGTLYTYFTDFLSGTIFNESVVNAVMRNVYIFIGVVVFFRLMMVLLKYIVNPELISDGKIGASNLVKRVIIGIAGITLIPTIFNFANDFQAAFLKDQVIQRLIVPEDLLEVTKKKVDNAGKYIGTYVMAGFFNPSSKVSPVNLKKYELAVEKGDMASLAFDFNDGGFLGVGYVFYEYSYFVFLSTFVLGYVLFLMLKYCLDLVTRLFKLFLYQMLAPFAMIEYMINGADDGVFKSWKTAVLSTYFMLFIRVFALWFVVFVMTLMSGDLPTDVYTTGSLLNSPNCLLRAIIIVALLGFMMDLPKIVGNIFGLDLEQEGSATGLLNSIKGGFAKIAGAGLTMGGAMVGGAIGAAKGGLGSLNALGAKKGADQFGTLQKKWNNMGIGKTKLGQMVGNSVLGGGQDKMNARADKLGTLRTTGKDALKASRSAVYKAGMGTNQYTSAVYGGYTSVNESVKNKADKRKAEEIQAAKDARDAENEAKEQKQRRESKNYEVAKTYNESAASKGKSKEQQVSEVKDLLIKGKVKDFDLDLANAQAGLQAIMKSGASIDVAANWLTQNIGNDLDITPREIKQMVTAVYNNDDPAQPGKTWVGTAEKSAEIMARVKVRAEDIALDDAELAVNQVRGHRINDVIEDTVQTVHRTFEDANDKLGNIHQTIHRDIVENTTIIKDLRTNIDENFTRTNTNINRFENTVHNDAVTTHNVITDQVNQLGNTIEGEGNQTRSTIKDQTDRLL